MKPAAAIAWVLALSPALSWAAAGATPPPLERPLEQPLERPLERPLEDVAGLVVQRVVTGVGQEFYRLFVEAWRQDAPDGPAELVVFERPSAQWGRLVWVEYQGRQVYRVFIAPSRRQQVPRLAAAAARDVADLVGRLQIERTLFRDPDLAPDEL